MCPSSGWVSSAVITIQCPNLNSNTRLWRSGTPMKPVAASVPFAELVILKSLSCRCRRNMGGGKLVFKGDEPKKKKKKSKHDKKRTGTATSEVEHDEARASSSAAGAASSSKSPDATSSAAVRQAQVPTVRKGTGLVTVSGTVVTGHQTRFTKEVSAGDALIVGDEMRVVTIRLSDTSLNLSSGFAASISTPTPFSYIPKPKTEQSLKAEATRRAMTEAERQKEEKEHAFGTYGSSRELVYREKTEQNSYRIRRIKVGLGEDLTRTDLLEMRAKKKSDKYC